MLGGSWIDARNFDPDTELEKPKNAIQLRVIPPLLDNAAGVRGRRSVAVIKPPDMGVCQSAPDMAKIDGDLAGKGGLDAAPPPLRMRQPYLIRGQMRQQGRAQPEQDHALESTPQPQAAHRIRPTGSKGGTLRPMAGPLPQYRARAC